jgi:serine phosphatase RsbU (regulator of sigma subunit)
MGHGASAAMMTGIVKTQLRSLASQETDPAGILLELDAALRGLTIHRFLTILLVIDEGASGGIRYCGAGHPPGILRTPDGAILPLESDGPPLNILGLDPYPRHSEILPRVAGSRIFICTDGFADAESLDGARLNESPDFRAVVEQALQLPPVPARTRLDEMLAAHIRGKDQEDDRALLVAELR